MIGDNLWRDKVKLLIKLLKELFGNNCLFFLPLLFGTFFQQLYNTVDAIVVGKYVGKEALSAVGGTTGVFINLLVGFVSVSSGATVAISQYYGGNDEEKCK